MNDNDRRRFETFVRVRDFGSEHTADFDANSLGRQLFTSLGVVVTEVEGHASSQTSARGASRQGTDTRAHARAALRDDLEAIRRTARALDGVVRGLSDKFRVPHNTNDQDLLNAGRAAHTDATPIKTQFIAHEMPADFLEDLQADIDALEASISGQSTGVGQHVAAGAALDDAIARGMDIVRKLDAIVRNKHANNAAVLAEWTSASHTERTPRRAKAASAPTPPTPGH